MYIDGWVCRRSTLVLGEAVQRERPLTDRQAPVFRSGAAGCVAQYPSVPFSGCLLSLLLPTWWKGRDQDFHWSVPLLLQLGDFLESKFENNLAWCTEISLVLQSRGKIPTGEICKMSHEWKHQPLAQSFIKLSGGSTLSILCLWWGILIQHFPAGSDGKESAIWVISRGLGHPLCQLMKSHCPSLASRTSRTSPQSSNWIR